MIEHEFTPRIVAILTEQFGDDATEIFEKSELLQYLNIKTKSASRGSKSRAAFGNHYALYVLVEDYVKHGFHEKGNYKDYEGARFSDLFKRQRELPFGSKLQNHALNHRLNQEFRKFFPTCEYIPILRDAKTNRYCINEYLLLVNINQKTVNIAEAVLRIIDAYIEAKKSAFEQFIHNCQQMQDIENHNPEDLQEFIRSLVKPNVDARIFEIVSYAVLKEYYAGQVIYWGWSLDDIQEDYLHLYKTGRTNANDGGIDFVMRPLGRFFQVTETVDVRKYFLDIDKVQRYPITFVVKSNDPKETILKKIRERAEKAYKVKKIVDRYMSCVEEIINIPILLDRFAEVLKSGKLEGVIKELVVQARVEFDTVKHCV